MTNRELFHVYTRVAKYGPFKGSYFKDVDFSWFVTERKEPLPMPYKSVWLTKGFQDIQGLSPVWRAIAHPIPEMFPTVGPAQLEENHAENCRTRTRR